MIANASMTISWFTLIFVPLMLILPWGCAWRWPATTQDPEVLKQIRARVQRLGGWTLLALLLWSACAWLSQLNPEQAWLATLVRVGWIGYAPLWTMGTMRILALKQPAVHSGPSVRVALLANRERHNPIQRWHWLCLWGFSLGWVALILCSPNAMRGWWAAGYAAQVLLTAAILPWGLRLSLAEPEPMDAGASEELAQAYRQLRSAKLKALFWLLGVGMLSLFGACAALATWMPSGEWAAWLGALGGSAVGIAGALVGVYFGNRRAQIAAYKAQLDQRGDGLGEGRSLGRQS